MAKIVLNLSFPTNFVTSADHAIKDSSLCTTKELLPVTFTAPPLDVPDVNKIVIGEVLVLGAENTIGEEIPAMIIQTNEEENHFMGAYFEKVEVILDEESVGTFSEGYKILFSMRADLFNDESIAKGVSELDKETDDPAEFICSQSISVEGDDGQEEFEYFILPESSEEDVVFPESIKEKGGKRWHFIYDEESIPTDKAPKNKGGFKRFIFRIFRLNSLRKQGEKIYKTFKEDPQYKGLGEDKLLDMTIVELKKDEKISSEIKNSYAINIYRPTNQDEAPFVPIDDNENRIDPSLKTLILVPGTFKKSIVKTNKSSENKKWQGSFKYLMHETLGHRNWFEYLLTNSEYKQIITLEHNSTFDNIQDNMRFFIDHLNISNIRFEKSTTVISASRGGFLAKMLARVGAGYDDQISQDEINLNIERIITVANGFSGYLEPSQKGGVKKKVELLFNLINIITLGGLTPFAGLFSFTPNFILRLPGLKDQTKDSDEIVRLKSKKLDKLWCLPLANDAKMKKLFFVEKSFVDPLLGPANDFVVSFESQMEVEPGQLMQGFDPIIGHYQHGKGLSDEQTRASLLAFLNAADTPHSPNSLINKDVSE